MNSKSWNIWLVDMYVTTVYTWEEACAWQESGYSAFLNEVEEE